MLEWHHQGDMYEIITGSISCDYFVIVGLKHVAGELGSLFVIVMYLTGLPKVYSDLYFLYSCPLLPDGCSKWFISYPTFQWTRQPSVEFRA
jgi:hypothetical protein